MGRLIVHVDMDAFFAAIEQRDDPDLAGKPVIIGADPKGGRGRGVVSTCSYEARRFGVHSAMPISTAWRKCPKAVFLPVDMEKYSRVSEDVYRVLGSFSPDLEPVSIDEAFLDISGTCRLFGSPLETCLKIKSRIREETGLTASIGLAPNKMAAKIASDLKKPDGLVIVTEDKLLDFLRPLEVSRIPGLGKKTGEFLCQRGIRTIGELARRDPAGLIGMLGKPGYDFWQLANGHDERPVTADQEAKSVSGEITFDSDTRDRKTIESALINLCEKLSRRLRSSGIKARTVTLKIRVEGFLTHTRSETLLSPTNFADELYLEIKKLYNGFRSPSRIRLVGVKCSGLTRQDDGDLFSGNYKLKKEKIHRAIDKIREKFGDESILRAALK